MKYTHLIVTLSFFFSLSLANAKDSYISVGKDLKTHFSVLKNQITLFENKEGSVFKVSDENELEKLSESIHSTHLRCPGFFSHESKAEAIAYLENFSKKSSTEKQIAVSLTESETVKKFIAQTEEKYILQTIADLSAFQNRFYTSKTGTDSSDFILNLWKKIAASRADITVEKFAHSGWPQSSIVLTIPGTDLKNEIVVAGGHQDSINQSGGNAKARAPGSDDNASGIATLTEALRVLVDSDYHPKRTLQFMAYAAEEVGLKGSNEIAKKYKSQKKNVVGVLQFDMTNFKGTKEFDINLISDHTNKKQNEFVGSLITTYLGVPFTSDPCGYACSDHASWDSQGYVASFPFEAKMKDHNRNIHTENDTLAVSQNSAKHAEKFSKLAIAYFVEMGK